MGDTLPSGAAHFTSRMTSRSQQGKTPGSSDHDPQQPSGSQLLACSCPAIPGREASGRLWLGGPQGMPVSQHPPKKQYLPTPRLLGTILSHPWEAMPGTSPENPKLNNSLPPGGNQLASLLRNWQAQKVMQSFSENWERGRELCLSKSASKWAPRQWGGGERFFKELVNRFTHLPTRPLLLMSAQRPQARCEPHRSPEPYSRPRGQSSALTHSGKTASASCEADPQLGQGIKLPLWDSAL